MRKIIQAINWPLLMDRVAMWAFLAVAVCLVVFAAYIPNLVAR